MNLKKCSFDLDFKVNNDAQEKNDGKNDIINELKTQSFKAISSIPKIPKIPNMKNTNLKTNSVPSATKSLNTVKTNDKPNVPKIPFIEKKNLKSPLKVPLIPNKNKDIVNLFESSKSN